MEILNIEKTFLVVWTSFDKDRGGAVGSVNSVQVHEVPRCPEYTANMLDRAKTFYFDSYLPNLIQTQQELQRICMHMQLQLPRTGDGGGSGGGERGGVVAAGAGSGSSDEAPLGPSEYERKAMALISEKVIMASDGAPAVIVRRNQDEEREAAREAAMGDGEEAASMYLNDNALVSAGGFHFGKEVYTMNGEAGESCRSVQF